MTRIFVRRRPADRALALIAGFAVLLTAALSAAMPVSAAATPSYLFKTGSAAASYVPPSDLHVVFSWSDAAGNLDFTRYQQRTTVNGNPVDVDGAQVTVVA